MVRQPIKDWLTACFKMPILEDVINTDVEKAIGYSLQEETIKTTYQLNNKINFDVSFSIFMRTSKDKRTIGLLTVGLANKKNWPSGFIVRGIDGNELVAWENNTHQVISKNVHCFINLEYDQIKDVITDIELIPPPAC